MFDVISLPLPLKITNVFLIALDPDAIELLFPRLFTCESILPDICRGDADSNSSISVNRKGNWMSHFDIISHNLWDSPRRSWGWPRSTGTRNTPSPWHSSPLNVCWLCFGFLPLKHENQFPILDVVGACTRSHQFTSSQISDFCSSGSSAMAPAYSHLQLTLYFLVIHVRLNSIVDWHIYNGRSR